MSEFDKWFMDEFRGYTAREEYSAATAWFSGKPYIQIGWNAAQSELAALREELAQTKDVLATANRTLGEFADDSQIYQQRLTAAEQRNAELIELLYEVIPYEAYLGSKLFNRISAAINPTDLVQAVCTSCDGSGEYSDAIGDWRGYCSCPAGVALKDKPTESGASE